VIFGVFLPARLPLLAGWDHRETLWVAVIVNPAGFSVAMDRDGKSLLPVASWQYCVGFV